MSSCQRGNVRRSPSVLAPLPRGSLVRLSCVGDPWLSRYHGLFGRVVTSDGTVVEVALSAGSVVSFWRHEVTRLTAPYEPPAKLTESNSESLVSSTAVPGFSLQAERQRAGLTQRAMARAMGVTVQRISQIEGQLAVRPPTVARYVLAIRAAVESCAA